MEWLALMADPLLAQSPIDRLQSAAQRAGFGWRLLSEPTGLETGDSTTSTLDPKTVARHVQRADALRPRTRSLATGEPVVPYCLASNLTGVASTTG